MDANKRGYTELIGGSVQFVIPVFQRDYSWAEEQCARLWEDVERAGKKGDGEHFFGPVVYISTAGQSAAFTRWRLIDGQQRMTTVSLLMAAIRDHIKEQPASQNIINEADKIEPYFLVNTQEKGDQRPKLVLRRWDEPTLRWIVDSAREPADNDKSKILHRNYWFFRNKLNLRGTDVNIILKGIYSLTIVDVRLDRIKDDPQQIFDSLNSTGLDLTQTDQARNYVLMGLEDNLQTKLYNEHWQELERLYSGRANELDNFLRDFVALETEATKLIRADQVYASFRVAFDDDKNDTAKLEDLLCRMTRFGRYHAAFVIGSHKFPRVIDDHLRRLRTLATTPAILIMRLLELDDLKHFAEGELAEALTLVESYLVRRYVCGLPAHSYWQQFSKLAYALRANDVLGSLKAGLHLLKSNYAFPTNQEFKQALKEANLYNRSICRTVLDGLENRNSKEQTDTRLYQIEHIMPQNDKLSEDWQRMLGKDWKEVQAIYLHRLGNLTLTAYNQKYSDRPFEEKKTIDHGFNDSPLRLNKYVAQQPKWTRDEMAERGEKLSVQALGIWRNLEVPPDSLRHAKESELLRESQGDVRVVREGMDDETKNLFDAFDDFIKSLGKDVIEVVKPKSVSYHHNAEFFCEMITRARAIQVLLAVKLGECVETSLAVCDTADSPKAIPNSQQYDAHCYVWLETVEEVAACGPLVRQALAVSKE